MASTVALVLAAGLVAAALVGLADAAYFVAVGYRWIAPDAAWIPRACRMDEETCASIVDTSYGRALGLPNAVYGAGWYLLALGAGAWLAVHGSLAACGPLLLVAAVAVGFSVYLLWSLVERLAADCPLCYLGHGLNFLIVLLLGAACAVG